MMTVCTHARLIGHRWRVCFASWEVYLDQAKIWGFHFLMPAAEQDACLGLFTCQYILDQFYVSKSLSVTLYTLPRSRRWFGWSTDPLDSSLD